MDGFFVEPNKNSLTNREFCKLFNVLSSLVIQTPPSPIFRFNRPITNQRSCNTFQVVVHCTASVYGVHINPEYIYRV